MLVQLHELCLHHSLEPWNTHSTAVTAFYQTYGVAYAVAIKHTPFHVQKTE